MVNPEQNIALLIGCFRPPACVRRNLEGRNSLDSFSVVVMSTREYRSFSCEHSTGVIHSLLPDTHSMKLSRCLPCEQVFVNSKLSLAVDRPLVLYLQFALYVTCTLIYTCRSRYRNNGNFNFNFFLNLISFRFLHYFITLELFEFRVENKIGISKLNRKYRNGA
jgi:hypothetical protein